MVPIEYDPGDDDIVEGVRTVDRWAGELRRCFEDIENEGEDKDRFERVGGREGDIIPDAVD